MRRWDCWRWQALQHTLPSRSQSNDRTDMSWGVGIGLETRVPQKLYPNKIGLSLEYMDYGDKYDMPIDAIEAGIQFFF